MASDPALDPAFGVDPSAEAARRLAALARWRKRSELVRFYRRALPAAMIALILFGVGWVAVRALTAGMHKGESVGSIHLLHPTFYGRNDRGERYILKADEAVRDGADPNRIALSSPKMWQFTDAPLPQTVVANRGVYLEKERLLDLYGDVQATDGQGYHFRSEFAHVDMPKNSVVGQTAMSGYGPSGTISASSYAVYDKGQHLVFRGAVHTHLVNVQSSKPAATPAKH